VVQGSVQFSSAEGPGKEILVAKVHHEAGQATASGNPWPHGRAGYTAEEKKKEAHSG